MIAVRAPNHLGDGVMAHPAVRALAAIDAVTVHAPRWGLDLYRGLGVEVVPRGPMRADVAVLFAPSLRAAWEARACARRIGVPGDARSWLLTDRVPEGRHRADTYRALAEAAGAQGVGEPRWDVDGAAPDMPAGHVGLNPVSVGGVVRDWRGWLALADHLERPIVFYGGPGEDDRVAAIAGPHRRVVGLPLPRFAAALQRCAVFVSNDSGAAHFARACGTRTVVVFGSTTATRTGPSGARAVEGPSLPCRPCYKHTCRLVGAKRTPPCLDIPVRDVLVAVREVLGG